MFFDDLSWTLAMAPKIRSNDQWPPWRKTQVSQLLAPASLARQKPFNVRQLRFDGFAARIVREHLTIMRDGFGQPADAAQRDREMIVRVGVARIELRGPPVKLDRLIRLAIGIQRDTESIERKGVIGVERHR